MLTLEQIKEFVGIETFQRSHKAALVEYLQYEILDSLYKQKNSEKLSFIGGTSIRIVYGSQRFSEDLDFDNLSRGERNRLILGLSFAFRDVWESLYSPINTLFIDELIYSGLDTMGVENSLAILKDMSRRRQKSIWLVSHREELAGRVPNVLKVVKENGFTSYSNSVDIDNA